MAKDVVLAITKDHRKVEELFVKYAALEGASQGPRTARQRSRIFADIRRELSVHAAAEEQTLYPELPSALRNGERLADDALDEHAEVKRTLTGPAESFPPRDGES